MKWFSNIATKKFVACENFLNRSKRFVSVTHTHTNDNVLSLSLSKRISQSKVKSLPQYLLFSTSRDICIECFVIVNVLQIAPGCWKLQFYCIRWNGNGLNEFGVPVCNCLVKNVSQTLSYAATLFMKVGPIFRIFEREKTQPLNKSNQILFILKKIIRFCLHLNAVAVKFTKGDHCS